MVTTPDSSGSRSTSSARRSHSGSSSRNSTPWCASDISPGRGSAPPPTSATALAVWCGDAERPLAPARRIQAAAAHRSDRGGFQRFGFARFRQQARQARGEQRLAAAGRPDQQQVVPAGGGDLQRAARVRLSAHVGQVGAACAHGRQALRRAATPCGRRASRRPRAGCARCWPRPATPALLRRRCPPAPPACARPARRPAPPAARRRPRAVHRSGPVRRGIRTRASASSGICPLAARMPSAIGRSKRPPSLGRSAGARFTVMHPRREFVLRAGDRRAHAVLGFAHRRLGQADDRHARQSAGQMHLDAHRGRTHARSRTAVHECQVHGGGSVARRGGAAAAQCCRAALPARPRCAAARPASRACAAAPRAALRTPRA